MPYVKTTKEEIIKKSALLFKSKGYHATSIADLAEVCGITKGNFYHHFENKEALMIAAIKSNHDFIKKKLFNIAYSDQPVTEKLKDIMDRIFQIFSSDLSGCFMANTILETAFTVPVFKESLKIFFEDWTDTMAHLYSHK